MDNLEVAAEVLTTAVAKIRNTGLHVTGANIVPSGIGEALAIEVTLVMSKEMWDKAVRDLSGS